MSDLHLGFRQFAATVAGRNQREVDVERAWEQAVELTIDEQPDLITLAGDNFHNARPSFHAVRAFQRGIRRLVSETDAHVVIILGNHEASKTAEALSPVVVVEGEQRVHVVTEPKRLILRPRNSGRIAVACLPFVALADEERYTIAPDPDAHVNVLLVHAAVRSSATPDAVPSFYAGETALDVGREASAWDVIACGDFHEYRELHPSRLAFYSGSTERTSSNIWPETAPKGVVVYDTESNTMALREIETRHVVSYDYHDLISYGIEPDAFGVNDALAQLVDDGGDLFGAIVRLVVEGFPRHQRTDIDYALVRQLKERTRHFQLDLRFANPEATEAGDRRDRAVRTLTDEATDFFAADPAPVRELVLSYLGGGV